MMRDRLLPAMLILTVLLGLVACSSDSDEPGTSVATPEQDRLDIEANLAETAGRWRYGDKAVLFDQEFEYLRVEHTYDSYLEIDRIKRMEADTLRAFDIHNIKLFDRDSAVVSLDVVFVGPTEDTTLMPQEWTMYYHRDRWIRPTLSTRQLQAHFDERRRLADSAAAAEEDGEDW
jgi:hypothetical protein